jgi:hypothetical protein
MWRSTAGTAAAFACVLMLAGCGKGSGSTATVTGTVKFKGEPIANGAITFIPDDGNGQSVSAKIVDGRYSIEVGPGPKKVTIMGEKVIGKQKQDPKFPRSEVKDMTEQFVPDEFNTATTLKRTVDAGGGEINFDLVPTGIKRPTGGRRPEPNLRR